MNPAEGRLMAALRPYLIRRRIIGAATGGLTGLAVAGLIAGVATLLHGRGVLVEPLLRWVCSAVVALAALAWAAMSLRAIDAALAIERRFPFLQDRVATAVDLLSRGNDRIPRSEVSMLRITAEATAALDDLPIARAVPLSSMRRPALVAGLGLGLAVLAWSAAPARKTPGSVPLRPQITQNASLETPAQSPSIFDVAVTVEPPRYCGLPRHTLTDKLDSIQALVGSKITVSGVCSSPAGRVSFVAERVGNAELRPSSDGRITHSFTLSGALRWRLETTAEGGSVATPWRTILPTEDALPRVQISRPQSDVTLAMAEPVEVTVSAADDFGISALGIRVRLAGEDAWRSMALEFTPGSATTSSVRLHPAGVGLKSGEELIVVAWATDNDAVGGPKTALSRPIRIRLEEPGGELQRSEPETLVERAQREEADAMEQLQRIAEELQGQLSEAIEGAQRGLREMSGESGGAQEMPTRPGMELQEAARRLREQAGRMEQAMRKAEEQLTSQQLSPELMQKIREFHELMRDVLDEDMRQALEELQKAITAQHPEEMQMSLEAAQKAQERFMQRLEQTMSLLKRARLEAALEQLRELAEELAKRQQKLCEQTRHISDGRSQKSREAERDQKLLARDTQPLADRVETAVAQARDVSDDLGVKLGAVADRLRRQDLAGQMRRAANALQRGSPSDAGAPQQEAGQSLQQAADDLGELEQQLGSDFTAEARRKLAEMLRDTLSLSHSQENVRDGVQALGVRTLADLIRDKRPITPLRRRQDTLTEAMGGLAQRMQALAQETPAMNPMFGRLAETMAEEMAQTAHEIEGADISSAVIRGGDVIAGLNELAKKLLETDEQLSQQSAQSALSEYMERLKSLADRQQGLNQQTGDAQQGQSGERRPGEGPGTSLSQMAYEQTLIQQALKQMLREGREGKATRPVADQLGGVPGEMEKVEGDLRSGRIKRETVERQGRILEKMLEAQRSLYTKDRERSERKAERPEAFEPPPSPPAISPSLLSRPSLEVERGGGRGRLPRGYEDLVREYYRRLGEEPGR